MHTYHSCFTSVNREVQLCIKKDRKSSMIWFASPSCLFKNLLLKMWGVISFVILTAILVCLLLLLLFIRSIASSLSSSFISSLYHNFCILRHAINTSSSMNSLQVIFYNYFNRIKINLAWVYNNLQNTTVGQMFAHLCAIFGNMAVLFQCCCHAEAVNHPLDRMKCFSKK